MFTILVSEKYFHLWFHTKFSQNVTYLDGHMFFFSLKSFFTHSKHIFSVLKLAQKIISSVQHSHKKSVAAKDFQKSPKKRADALPEAFLVQNSRRFYTRAFNDFRAPYDTVNKFFCASWFSKYVRSESSERVDRPTLSFLCVRFKDMPKIWKSTKCQMKMILILLIFSIFLQIFWQDHRFCRSHFKFFRFYSNIWFCLAKLTF